MIESYPDLSIEDINAILDNDPRLLEKLMAISQTSTIKEFASYMGVSEQSINNAKRSKKIPDRWIFYVTTREGLPLRYIQFFSPETLEKDLNKASFNFIPITENLLAYYGQADQYLDINQAMMDATSYRPFRKHFFQVKGVDSNKSLVFKVQTTTMSPLLTAGNYALVDTSSQEIAFGNIYLLLCQTGVLLGRIAPTGTSGFKILFENKEFDSITVEYPSIIGRIEWFSMAE